MMGMEDDVGHIADAELHAIVPLQRLALYPFTVDESSVLAALVHYAELPVFRGDHSMVAGDARIGNDEIFVHFAPHGKWAMVEIDRPLLVALHKYQGWKKAGTRFRRSDAMAISRPPALCGYRHRIACRPGTARRLPLASRE